MSVMNVVFYFAFIAQVGGGDRYGAPQGEAPSVLSPPPATANPLRKSAVSPPPAFAPAVDEDDTTPITGEGIDYGAPPARPNVPAVVPPVATPPVTTQPAVTPPANVGASSATKPSTMMAAMLSSPGSSRLAGRQVRLTEVVAGASSREAQSQRIEAYWDLCSSVADYYLGVREQDELQRLRSTVTSVGPAWQQAEAELGVRLGTSQRAAVAAQYRLASLMGSADAAGLPLPADMPHCGDYYARYDQVFAGRASPEAQQLSELLPMRYQELCDASLAVSRAEEFLGAVAAQRGGDGTGSLRALELLALRRRAFVQIARDYNRRIERYTELASPGQIGSDRLIGMLIMRAGASNTATRPATLSPPPNRQSQVSMEEDAQTFAEGWESIKSASAEFPIDEDEEPASVEARRSKPRRERSLLVPSE